MVLSSWFGTQINQSKHYTQHLQPILLHRHSKGMDELQALIAQTRSSFQLNTLHGNPPSSPTKRRRAWSVERSAPNTANPDSSPSPTKKLRKQTMGHFRSLSVSNQSKAPESTYRTHARCNMCLSRDRHDVRSCTSTKLWDGTRAWSTRNTVGNLIGPDGRELCTNWQRPNGCTVSSHPDMHLCSGCGEKSHGAQDCPRGQPA